MGAFFTNVQVHTGGHPPAEIRNKIVEVVRGWILAGAYDEAAATDPTVDRHVVIGPVAQPWVAVYDELTETQHIDLLVELAIAVSNATGTPALGVLVHDSDVLELRLCREGRLIDSYSSEPDYFEKVGAKRRRELAGHPELWSDLLPPGAGLRRLREAMHKKALFAEDILRAIAEAVGLNPEQCLTGFNSLGEVGADEAAHVHLAFKSKAKAAEERRQPSGPPRLRLAGYPGSAKFGAGDHVDHILQFHVHNNGGPSRGFEVRLSGEGLSLFMPASAAAWLGSGLHRVEAPFVQVGNAPDPTYVAELPDFDLPATVSIDLPMLSSPASAAEAMRDYERALDKQSTNTVVVDIHGTGSAPGSGRLLVQIVPREDPAGAAEQVIALHVVAPAHRPLRSLEQSPSVTSELEALKTPRVLFALVALEAPREACADQAIHAIERWLQVISALGTETYRIIIQETLQDSIREQRIRVQAIPGGKRWIDLRNGLARYASVGGYLGYGQFTSGSGFSWKTDSIFLQDRGDAPAPHVGLWYDLGARKGEAVQRMLATLIDILDEMALRTGIMQGILARWNWAPTDVDSTPYERACGVAGQVTMGHSWCARFLRGVTDRMWLGPALLERVDVEALAAAAVVAPLGRAIRLTLKTGSTMNDLERALAPVLPGVDDWKAAAGFR